jgi:EH domain-containing protein 1
MLPVARSHPTATHCPLLLQVNEFVKRVRAFRIHLLIMGHLRKNMPAMFGKDKAQRKMLERLPDIFSQV